MLPGLNLMRSTYPDKVMTDTVTVTRKPLQMTDAIYDETTGRVHNNVVDERLVYSGQARISKGKRAAESQTIDDGTHQVLNRYTLSIPFGSPSLQTGLLVSVVASQNPSLVGETFTVLAPIEGTTSLAVRATMTRRETNRDG